MTTITLNDGTNTVTLNGVKIEQVLEKKLIEFDIPKVSNYTSTNPDHRIIDLGQMTRLITVTGKIQKDDFSPAATHSEAGRTVLEDMLRKARGLTVTWGNTTFTVFLFRAQITETPQDEDDSSVTTVYDIILSLKEGTSQID